GRIRHTLGAAAIEDIEKVLGDVDSDEARVYDHRCLSLCCEVRCKRPRSTVQVWVVTNGRGSSQLTVFSRDQGPNDLPPAHHHGTFPTHRGLYPRAFARRSARRHITAERMGPRFREGDIEFVACAARLRIPIQLSNSPTSMRPHTRHRPENCPAPGHAG